MFSWLFCVWTVKWCKKIAWCDNPGISATESPWKGHCYSGVVLKGWKRTRSICWIITHSSSEREQLIGGVVSIFGSLAILYSSFFSLSLSLHLFCRCTDDFDILQGDVQGLSDTWTFLKSLAKLDAVHDPENSMEKKTMRERKAAGGLFNWEVAFFLFLFPRLLFVPPVSILIRGYRK